METVGSSQQRSLIPQQTLNKLVKHLWTKAIASPKFLKLNNLCEEFRNAEKVLESAEFLAHGVSNCLFAEVIRPRTSHLNQVLTILYCLQIPVNMTVEEKVLLNGQVDNEKRINEYLSEDKSIELGERDPKHIHDLFEFLSTSCIQLTFSSLDLTELFVIFRQTFTKKPVRPMYLKKRFDDLLTEFRNCQLDIGVKALMLTGAVITDGTQKIFNNTGIIERDLERRIVTYTQRGTGVTLKKKYSPPEENEKRVMSYIKCFQKTMGNYLSKNLTLTPNQSLGFGVSHAPSSLKRRAEDEGNTTAKRSATGVQITCQTDEQNVNSKIALQALRRTLLGINPVVFQSLSQQVETKIASTSNNEEIDPQPISDSVRILLTQLQKKLYENEDSDDSFPVSIVFHALCHFLHELESPKLQEILEEVQFEEVTYEAERMKVPTNTCVEGFKEIFVACLPK